MLGTIILWFGWYGFNAGSALITESTNRAHLLSLCAVNTTLSGGAAGLTALFFNLYWLERRFGEPIFDLVVAMNGALAGLVAITAGCGVGTCVTFLILVGVLCRLVVPVCDLNTNCLGIPFASAPSPSRTVGCRCDWNYSWPVVHVWKWAANQASTG